MFEQQLFVSWWSSFGILCYAVGERSDISAEHTASTFTVTDSGSHGCCSSWEECFSCMGKLQGIWPIRAV